jgi:hypothetical protein
MRLLGEKGLGRNILEEKAPRTKLLGGKSDPYGHNLGNDETAETDENEEVAQIPPAKKPKYYLESGTISCSTEGCTDEFIRKSAHLRHLVLHHEIELKKARRMADCRAF